MYNFKRDWKKQRFIAAFIIIIGLCVIRGLSRQFLWKSGTFLEGFSYPFIIFVSGSILMLPLYLLRYKHPKAAENIASVLCIIGVLFLVMLVLLIGVLILNYFFHFLF